MAGHTEYNNSFRVGIRNDDPVLLNLFQKAVQNLDPKEENQILRKWISARIEHGTDYTLVAQVIGLAALVVLLLSYRHRSVQRVVVELNKANTLLEEQSTELHRLSRTDALTKISNRLYLDEILLEEANRFERYQSK